MELVIKEKLQLKINNQNGNHWAFYHLIFCIVFFNIVWFSLNNVQIVTCRHRKHAIVIIAAIATYHCPYSSFLFIDTTEMKKKKASFYKRNGWWCSASLMWFISLQIAYKSEIERQKERGRIALLQGISGFLDWYYRYLHRNRHIAHRVKAFEPHLRVGTQIYRLHLIARALLSSRV